jgi:hypothetical protein
MLGALAAVALVVGAIGASVTVSQDAKQATEQSREAVVEIHRAETANEVHE